VILAGGRKAAQQVLDTPQDTVCFLGEFEDDQVVLGLIAGRQHSPSPPHLMIGCPQYCSRFHSRHQIERVRSQLVRRQLIRS
jgi:hypothetical protein